MRNNFKIILIGIIALILVASAAAYVVLTPSSKMIELNGYKLEVPASNANVTSANEITEHMMTIIITLQSNHMQLII